MFDKKVTFQEVSPKVPSYALMFMLEGMTYKATVKVPEGMESKDIEVQAWTNQFDRNNPQGEWHAVVLKFMGPVPGSKTLLRFGCTDIITSAWDFHFTFRARVKSNSEPAMEWVWAGGWQVNGFVHVEPPRNGDHWTLGPDWNHIMGCIHLGNFIAASNASSLGFTHVLNVADNLDMVYPKKDVIYKKVSMQDGAHNPIEKPKLKESIDWLLENDRGKNKILVNCRAGIGRAGSVAVGFVFAKCRDISYEQAYNYCFERRFVYPHAGLKEKLYSLYPRKELHKNT